MMKPKRILITDDNADSLYFLRALMQGDGYQVVAAGNGVEALRLARENPPDLIISDILMPTMDGFSLCRAWKKDAALRAIPFIFYTATYTDDRDREFALSLGAERFIVKPEEPETLSAIVRDTLQQTETRPRLPEPAAEVPSSDAQPGPEADSVFLTQYNEALIRKLESKTEQLEFTNRRLARDIEERQKAEGALKESFEYLNQLINRIGDPIFVKDRQHRFLMVNDALCAFTGMKRSELIGQCVSDPSDRAVWEEEERILESGKEAVNEENVHDRLGNVHRVLSKKTLLTDKGGNRQIVGVLRDITEYKRLQAQFIQSQKMEAVGVLAGGIAHDFNNLLTVIKGNTEILMEDMDPADSRMQDFEQILHASQQAASLIGQLLAFSRRQVLRPKLMNLNDTLDEMGKMLRRLIREDIKINVTMQPDLHPILADPGQIQQIVMNLAVNARDAMPHGGQLTIETSNAYLDDEYQCSHPMVKAGPYVMLAVSDSGTGMDPETLARVFEPFFTTKEKGKGTGLGLSTVYGIVKQSNGFIWVYSEPGLGTTFKLYFPLAEGRSECEPEPDKSASVYRGSETILVVEDEAPVRALAARILRKYGYTVIEASDGLEALRRVRDFSGSIHLIITDVVMPGMSGKELMARLQKEYPDARSLYVSGYADDAIVHHGILASGVAFLQKPFSVESLTRKVWETLHA